MSLDAALQHFVQVPSPHEMEHAAFFVQRMAIASWDSGQRAESLAQETATGTRLDRVGLGLSATGAAEIGYWSIPVHESAGSRPPSKQCAGGLLRP